MDNERDRKLRHEVELLIQSLLDSLSPGNPSYWVALCRKVVLASAHMKGNTPQIKREDSDTAEQTSDDVGMLKAVPQESKDEEDSFVARWRTKVFCMECVRRIIGCVTNMPEHFDLALARKDQSRTSQDYLVFSLGELIKMAFTAATSDIEAMRPVGVYVMRDIVEVIVSGS